MKETIENVVQLHSIDDPLHELMTEFNGEPDQEFGVRVDVQKKEREAQIKVKSMREVIERMKFYLDEIDMVMP